MRSKRRAMALMLTLLVTVMLLLLTSAFFKVNLDQIRLGSQSEAERRAERAALSGLEYARMRLESDNQWGVPLAGRGRQLTIAGLQVFEDDRWDAGGTRLFVCVGVLNGGASTFQLTLAQPGTVLTDYAGGAFAQSSLLSQPLGPMSAWVLQTLPRSQVSINYLSAPTFAAPLRNAACPGRTLPPGQCLLQVRGSSQGVTRIAEATLGVERHSDSSVHAGGTLAVDVDSTGWWNISSVVGGRNRVEANGNMVVRGERSKPRVQFHGPNGSAATDGSIEVTDSIDAAIPLNTGNLRFSYGSARSDINVRPANAWSNGKYSPGGGANQAIDLQASAVESTLSQNTSVRETLDPGNYVFVEPNEIEVDGVTYRGEIVKNGKLLAKIHNYYLTFVEGVRVEVEGPMTISSVGARKPTVRMGYHRDGWLPSNSKGSYLKVNNGSLNVDGSLTGKGAVMTTGNSTHAGDLIMRGQSQMTSNADSAVTIFADRNIQVSPPDPTSAEFFSLDLAAISQGLENYASAQDSPPWNADSTPLNRFASLGASDQDRYTQGGASPIQDSVVSTATVKTSPITANLPQLKQALEDTFPVAANNTDVGDAFNSLFTQFSETGLTVGRFIRLREFLREAQAASDRGTTPPTLGTSPWADVTQNNQQINDQLKAELSFYHRQADQLGVSLKNLVNHPNARDPRSNQLTSRMTNNRDTRWTGFMYARGSVAVDAGGGTLDIRGSLVARGDVGVINARNVNSLYDPTYLNGLTRFDLQGSQGTKLATYVFRLR